MKKYGVGGSKQAIIALTVVSICMSLFLIIMFIVLSICEVIPWPLLLVVPIMCSTFIFGNIAIRKTYQRKTIALAGHKSTGTITEFYRMKSYYNVTVKFLSDSNEEIFFYTSVTYGKKDFFKVGKEIPIYVNGDYGYLDEDAIYNKKAKSYDSFGKLDLTNDSTFQYCPYCGFVIQRNIDRCPSCKSKLGI